MWNALAKGGADKHRTMTGIVLGHVPVALLALPFVPAPGAAALPWLCVGIGLHIGYQFLLLVSYRLGDLTQVYPIARGTAPLLIAVVSIAFLGVSLGRLELLAVATIAVGILSLALVRRGDGSTNPRAARSALATGCFIAAYSLVDGWGARASGSAIGYWAWSALGNAALFTAITARLRPDVLRRAAWTPRSVGAALFGGTASWVAYALVIWAFTQAPIALVSALRETSVVFALLIGTVVMRERLDLAKVLSTAATVGGAVLLRVARH